MRNLAPGQQVISTIEPRHNIMRLFDDVGLTGSVACRACGCLVYVRHDMMILHADRETNYRWRIELPDYASEA